MVIFGSFHISCKERNKKKNIFFYYNIFGSFQVFWHTGKTRGWRFNLAARAYLELVDITAFERENIIHVPSLLRLLLLLLPLLLRCWPTSHLLFSLYLLLISQNQQQQQQQQLSVSSIQPHKWSVYTFISSFHYNFSHLIILLSLLFSGGGPKTLSCRSKITRKALKNICRVFYTHSLPPLFNISINSWNPFHQICWIHQTFHAVGRNKKKYIYIYI